MDKIFSLRLSGLRKAAGLKQAELAKILNVSRSCLANYESSRRCPDVSILQSIADYFKVSVGYLIGKEDVVVKTQRAVECEAEIERVMREEGTLDISHFSPAAKIALVEFYQYLTGK